MRRTREHRAGVALFGDPAGVHHGDPVAGLGDDAEVVRDEQHRGVEAALHIREDRQDLRLHSTSSAVVGSSATTKAGLSTSTSAIMIRWRIPPENSCG